MLSENDIDVDAGIGTNPGVKLEYHDQATTAPVREADGEPVEEIDE